MSAVKRDAGRRRNFPLRDKHAVASSHDLHVEGARYPEIGPIKGDPIRPIGGRKSADDRSVAGPNLARSAGTVPPRVYDPHVGPLQGDAQRSRAGGHGAQNGTVGGAQLRDRTAAVVSDPDILPIK